VDSFLDKYPAFQLEDELLVEGGEMSCGATHMPGEGAPETCAELQLVALARKVARCRQRGDQGGLRIRSNWLQVVDALLAGAKFSNSLLSGGEKSE
jgi:hypothetical protein